MAKQTVTIRLDEDDLTYLSTMEMPGATNLSEKIRALLAEARTQREGTPQAVAAHDRAQQVFASPARLIRAAEMEEQVRSELLARLLSFLPETSATLLSGTAALAGTQGQDRINALERLERMLGERALSFMDATLQLAMAGFPGCYTPESLRQRSRQSLLLINPPTSHDTPQKD